MGITNPEYRTITIGGFRITVDPLLPIVLVLLAWILSERYYPHLIYSPDTTLYWILGASSALILSLSIIIHELGHAITARKLKLDLVGIHLFLFGGMAELKQRPIRPYEEFLIAVSGPVASFILAGVGYLIMIQVEPYHIPMYLLSQFLFLMNLLLGVFNLLPIFPLDGGRVLRALIWSYQKRFHHASVLTFQSSSVLIAVLFLATGISAFFLSLNNTLWAALLAIYLGYTALTGRRELITKPRFSDLIFRIDGDHTPAHIIEEVQSVGDHYLEKCIIPHIEKQKLKGMIYGSEIVFPELLTDLEPFVRKPQLGDYIEIDDYETYDSNINYNAEYIPVFQSDVFLGLCDANEMRFWLLERKT